MKNSTPRPDPKELGPRSTESGARMRLFLFVLVLVAPALAVFSVDFISSVMGLFLGRGGDDMKAGLILTLFFGNVLSGGVCSAMVDGLMPRTGGMLGRIFIWAVVTAVCCAAGMVITVFGCAVMQPGLRAAGTLFGSH